MQKLAILIAAVCFSVTPAFADTKAESMENVKTTNSSQEGKKLAVNETTKDMTKEQMISHIRVANEVAKRWKEFGHHPFGAVLVGPDNQEILMRQGNLNIVRHAETEISRRAAEAFSPEYLAKCTLVTTMEPCVMCSGNIYFANIGAVVFGGTEKTLATLTGTSDMNPTMDLPCRKVFEAGKKKIKVDGPFPELDAELLAPHKGFWK